MAKGLPGMPSNKQLRHQAGQIAGASLPSKHSIRRQFHRQEGDVAGFTTALVSLLKGEQGTAGQAYGDAVAQQQQIDASARQQLGNLGEAYQGAAVKVGATGDSATSRLLQGQAAAQDYASRQPGIAAGRGALGQTALENALTDALSQRADSYRSAFGPALQQVTQNAQNRSLAIANLGLSQQQLRDAESAQAFNQSEALKADQRANLSVKAQIAAARQSESHWRLSFIGRYGFDPYTGKRTGMGGSSGTPQWTPSEWRSALSDTAQIIAPPPDRVLDPTTHTYKRAAQKNFAQQGIPFLHAVQTLVSQHGVDHNVALVSVMRLYRTYANAPRDSPAYAAWHSYFNWIHQPSTPIGAAERGNQGLTGPH